MPHIFTTAGLGILELDSLPKRKINPLTPGKCWIRGMDQEPVLVDIDMIDFIEERLKNEDRNNGLFRFYRFKSVRTTFK